jgi:hypothetical protein
MPPLQMGKLDDLCYRRAEDWITLLQISITAFDPAIGTTHLCDCVARRRGTVKLRQAAGAFTQAVVA